MHGKDATVQVPAAVTNEEKVSALGNHLPAATNIPQTDLSTAMAANERTCTEPALNEQKSTASIVPGILDPRAQKMEMHTDTSSLKDAQVREGDRKENVLPNTIYVTNLQREFRGIVLGSRSLHQLSWEDFVRMTPEDTREFEKICSALEFGARMAIRRIHTQINA